MTILEKKIEDMCTEDRYYSLFGNWEMNLYNCDTHYNHICCSQLEKINESGTSCWDNRRGYLESQQNKENGDYHQQRQSCLRVEA